MIFPMLCLLAAGAEPNATAFRLAGLDGTTTLAAVQGMAADGSLLLTAGEPKRSPSWFSLHRPGVPRPQWPTTAQVILSNGDRIAGEILRGDESSLSVRAVFGKSKAEWRVPFSAIDVAWRASPPASSSAFPDCYAWLPAKRARDVALLANGEALAGDVAGFTADGDLKYSVSGKLRTLAANVIQAVAFNPALAAKKPATGDQYCIVTKSGTRLTAKECSADATTLKLTTSFGAKLELPWADVVAITRWSDKVVPLATWKPSKVEQTPFGSITWPWTVNRTVKHGPVTLTTADGFETFDRGLGTHPKTTLTYDLDGKFSAFEALVGLDATTGQKGAAVIAILVDGQARDVPGMNPLTAAAGPRTIRIELTRAKTLTLVTGFGPAGDVQADVNWADARLIR